MDIKDLKAPTTEERLTKMEKDLEKLKEEWKDYQDYRVAEAQKAIDGINGKGW